jgi:hypothetical protein
MLTSEELAQLENIRQLVNLNKGQPEFNAEYESLEEFIDVIHQDHAKEHADAATYTNLRKMQSIIYTYYLYNFMSSNKAAFYEHTAQEKILREITDNLVQRSPEAYAADVRHKSAGWFKYLEDGKPFINPDGRRETDLGELPAHEELYGENWWHYVEPRDVQHFGEIWDRYDAWQDDLAIYKETKMPGMPNMDREMLKAGTLIPTADATPAASKASEALSAVEALLADVPYADYATGEDNNDSHDIGSADDAPLDLLANITVANTTDTETTQSRISAASSEQSESASVIAARLAEEIANEEPPVMPTRGKLLTIAYNQSAKEPEKVENDSVTSRPKP